MPESTFTTWNTRPLFVSSTFADMHDERDYLRIHAFDVLAEQLKERRHYLEAIDLRQGLETTDERDETERELKVLRVCLDEIKRSRPFFVGLIGDRYGWMPPEERMAAAAQAAGFATEVAGKSVTELEILYGVLENPDQRQRSWFYLRELDYTGMPDEVRKRFDDRFAGNTERADKLDALKERLKRELPEHVHTYHAKWDPAQGKVVALEELAERVKRELWSAFDSQTKEWLRAAPRTWQEADERMLDDFVVDRLRIVEGEISGFVEREAVTQPLIDHALSPAAEGASWGLCLTGRAGSGKSSIVGRVYHDLQHPQPDDGANLLLLAHAAGIYPRASSVDTLLRRFIHELAAFLEIEDPVEAEESKDEGQRSIGGEDSPSPRSSNLSPEQIEKTFASLLGRAAQSTRVVILIDALNQFERSTRAKYLTWLPKLWPENARFIATAIPGTESEALAEKPGVEVKALAAMTREEARQIAHRYYKRFHREPNARALDVLLDKRPNRDEPDSPFAYGNPLWLELVLQEMNLLEADDYARAEQEFSHLPGGERIAALQMREAEALPPEPAGVYGELLARAGRDFGEVWSRALMKVIALGRAGWRESDLRALIPSVCGEAWDELAFAGVRRTLGAHLVQRGASAQWDAFHAQLRERILEHELGDKDERRRLHGFIADHLEGLPEDDSLRISETMVHLIGFGDRTRAARYLASLQDETSALLITATVLAQHAAGSPDGLDFMVGLTSAEGLNNQEIGRAANKLQFEGLEALEKETGLAPRLTLLEACRTAVDRLAQSDPSNAGWQRDLSVSHNNIGDVLRAQGNLGEALAAFRKSFAVAERLVQSDPSNAGWQRDLSVSQNNIGDVLRAQGNLGEALAAFRKSFAVAERLAQSDPSNAGWQRDLSVDQIRIGDVLRAQGNLGEVLAAFRKSFAVAERLAQSDPSNAGWQQDLTLSQDRIGEVLLAQGNLGEALAAFRKSFAVAERLTQSDPFKTPAGSET